MDYSCETPFTSELGNDSRGKWSAKVTWALGQLLRGAEEENCSE